MRAILFAAALALAPLAAEAQCRVTQVLELPVRFDNMHPLVEAEVNGEPARFVLDSGAATNLMSPGAARRYRLDLAPAADGEGLDGDISLSRTQVARFVLAGVAFRDVPFMVGGGGFGGGVMGLLGQDFIGATDVDYDFAAGRVRLLRRDGCAGPPAGFGDAVGVVSVRPSEPGLKDAIGEATINGVRLKVLFDTGGGPSMLSEDAARRVGLSPDDAAARPAGDLYGVGRGKMATWSATIRSFEIGGERFGETRVRVGDWNDSDGYADMILGADFFRSHHVFIANAAGQVYFSYRGGPLFEPDER